MIMMLVPDTAAAALYRQCIEPHLSDGKMLMFGEPLRLLVELVPAFTLICVAGSIHDEARISPFPFTCTLSIDSPAPPELVERIRGALKELAADPGDFIKRNLT